MQLVEISYKINWLIFSLFMFTACSPAVNNSTSEWSLLFDGSSLDEWDTYLGPQFKQDVTWENLREQPAIGLNNEGF